MFKSTNKVFSMEEELKRKEIKEFGDIDGSPIAKLGEFGKIMNIGERFVIINKSDRLRTKLFKRQRDFNNHHKDLSYSNSIIFKSYVIRDMIKKNFIFGDTFEECLETYFLKFSCERSSKQKEAL